MRSVTAIMLLLGLLACNASSSEPAGTSADPVTVCERIGDVCRLDKARLGVCSAVDAAGNELACMPQH